MKRHFSFFLLPLTLFGCAVGPDYVRPSVQTPASFAIPTGWKVAESQGAPIPSAWWALFNDPQLDQYERQVPIANQTIAQQEAAWRQAQAAVGTAQAGLFPTLNANAVNSRTRASAGAIGLAQGAIYDNDQAALQATWIPDLWGSVRRSIEASKANLQASADQLAATLLTLQGQLALDYFQLRADDAQKALLQATVEAYKKSLDLTVERRASGIAADTDVLLAENQLQTAQAQLIDVGVQRTQMEHAIAILVGVPPSGFHVPETPLGQGYPEVPVTLPSVLLERRPDIATAERSMAAASAEIGVAQAAFFPTLSLDGSAGYQNRAYTHLFQVPNQFWAFSPQLSLPIFNGGLLSAALDSARATFDQAVANYREVVLVAFQNVEDNLTATAILTDEIRVQQQAVASAKKNADLTEQQYIAGTVAYLNVIVAQTQLLTNQLTELSLRSRAFASSVQLITALGGGWQSPTDKVAANQTH